MDQSSTNVLSAEDVDVASPVKEDEIYEETMPDLIAEAEEAYATYDPDTSLPTPDAKLDENHQLAPASSAAANSSELSIKEGSESSPSLSDSDSESSNSSNAYYSLPLNTDRKVLSYQNIAEIPSMGDKLEMEAAGERNPTYEELLRKVDMYEDNLKASNLRLEKSEEEVSWLKNELKSGIETFQSELDSAYRVITVREADLEIERRKVVLLENEIAESMLEVQNQLKFAQEEMETLKAEHSHVRKLARELEEINLSYKNQLSDRDAEVKALEASLTSTEEKFNVERSSLQSDISSYSEKQNLLEASITELESLRISLEGKLMQCETEKMEMKTLLDAQEVQSQTEISQLKADLENSGKQIEDLNKNFDSLKHKHDMVIAEKDELNAKVDTMTAETAHQQNQIAEKEEHLRLLNLENGDLIADSESLRKLVEDLRSRVAELENEVERQSGEIVSGAEEKREAIRQLCFALEHYRSCYKELRQAIIGHKRVQIPA
ncbi:Protein NETWORKED 4B [Linum perenne]